MTGENLAVGILFAIGTAVALAGVLAMPLLLIWSLNTLFAAGIAYTIWTYLAALCLLLMTATFCRGWGGRRKG